MYIFYIYIIYIRYKYIYQIEYICPVNVNLYFDLNLIIIRVL